MAFTVRGLLGRIRGFRPDIKEDAEIEYHLQESVRRTCRQTMLAQENKRLVVLAGQRGVKIVPGNSADINRIHLVRRVANPIKKPSPPTLSAGPYLPDSSTTRTSTPPFVDTVGHTINTDLFVVDGSFRFYAHNRSGGTYGVLGIERRIESGGSMIVDNSFVPTPSPPSITTGPGNILGMAIDKTGNVYAVDSALGKAFKVTPSGVVTELTSDGVFNNASRIAINNTTGVVYVTKDGGLYSVVGGVATLICGNLTIGDLDGTGGAARIGEIYGLTVDEGNNLIYVLSRHSGTTKLKRITASGTVTTITTIAQTVISNQANALAFINNTLFFVTKAGGTFKCTTTGTVTLHNATATATGIQAELNSMRLYIIEGADASTQYVSGVLYIGYFAPLAGPLSGSVSYYIQIIGTNGTSSAASNAATFTATATGTIKIDFGSVPYIPDGESFVGWKLYRVIGAGSPYELTSITDVNWNLITTTYSTSELANGSLYQGIDRGTDGTSLVTEIPSVAIGRLETMSEMNDVGVFHGDSTPDRDRGVSIGWSLGGTDTTDQGYLNVWPTSSEDQYFFAQYSVIPTGEIDTIPLPPEAEECIFNGTMATIMALPGPNQSLPQSMRYEAKYAHEVGNLKAVATLGRSGNLQVRASRPLGGFYRGRY